MSRAERVLVVLGAITLSTGVALIDVRFALIIGGGLLLMAGLLLGDEL